LANEIRSTNSMGRFKSVGLALMALLALGGGATSAADAAETEGPLILVKSEWLGSGESREVKANAKASFIFKSKTVKAKIECKALKLKPGGTVNGSSRKSGGMGKMVLELSECHGAAKEEALTGCEPEGGKITSVALADTVGYSTSLRTGAVLMEVAPESGTTLATVKFTGEKCIATTATISGALIGEIFESGKVVEVGVNEVESVSPEIKFGTTGKTISTESEGALTSVKSSLMLFGVESTLEGAAALELASALPWGPVPIPELRGEAYAFTPRFLEYLKLTGEEQAFTVEDVGSSNLELRNLKIGGGEAAHWEITDKHFCRVKTIVTLGRCEVTVKLLEGSSGGAVFEGEVKFEGGTQFAFPARSLVN
jgi:hypothetical protein